MFSLYGSKGKLAKYYPLPLYDEIIEPFAGSAKYSLLHWEHKVTLIEVDPKIYGVWTYLQKASPRDILSLPDVPNATRLDSIMGFKYLSDEEKWLIGFCSNGGSAQPKNVSGRHNFNSWNRDKIRIAKSLHKIKHWLILNKSYLNIENKKATHFIDPPYMDKGKWYKYNDINYTELAEWCKARIGQVMVCENVGAGWLPFKHLKDIHFSHFKTEVDKKRKTAEGLWYKERSNL